MFTNNVNKAAYSTKLGPRHAGFTEILILIWRHYGITRIGLIFHTSYNSCRIYLENVNQRELCMSLMIPCIMTEAEESIRADSREDNLTLIWASILEYSFSFVCKFECSS